MDKTGELLRRDTIAETEEILGGKHWSKFDDGENSFMLLKAMCDNMEKAKHLKSIGDTYWNISWTDFLTLLDKQGFVEALRYDIHHGDNEVDEAIIYYHPQKGLVLWAESYWNKKSINGGKVYGFIKYDKNDWENIGRALHGCSHGPTKTAKELMHFDKDIREGLVYTLDRIGGQAEFISKWPERPFLWFVDYVEDDVPGYDYKAITAEKISRCPKELRDIVGEEVK